ncbi:PREDICTED: uncharacterized protein LOC104814298 [Tarenaya hassleriana]|uniref:uncharacterized protein LOC104814298 n=1 Tax=Tarenaya hassleriana TaxID=28532 RepID=UPI00053C8B7E|nr:PREDICTED: uncharacterized protein LOC104814298 [Tarenaya hassleriana]
MASTFLLGHAPKFTIPISFTNKPIIRSRNPVRDFSCDGCQTHRSFFRPIIMAKDDRNGNKASRHRDEKKLLTPLKMVAGASLAAACALSFFGCKLKNMNPSPAIAQPSAADMMIWEKPPVSALSNSGMYPFQAKSALRSLFDVTAMLASEKPIPPSKGSFNLRKLPPFPSREDIDSIKLEAIRRMKAGKCEEAVQILRDANMKYKNEPEAEFSVQMALVEILILLERYGEAAEYRCISDEHSHISDVRIPLYKAIIYTMLDRDSEAKQCWKEFRKSIGEGVDFDPFSFGD